MKHEEHQKMRLQLDQLRQDLEHSYQQRLHIYEEREMQQKQNLVESERRIQALEYDSRQRIQRELDEIRTREETSRRKHELELQSIKMVETRLKETQAMIESREREVIRKEKELQLKSAELHTAAHEEARSAVETEFEGILREKASLMIERKRFEDEKANDQSLRLAISEMRSRHREMENQIADKDDEINTLKSTLSRLQNSLVAEDKDVSLLLDSCGWTEKRKLGQNASPGSISDPEMALDQLDAPTAAALGLGVSGKMDGIILMIRKNIQLEANVAQLQRDITKEVENTVLAKRKSDGLMVNLDLCQKEIEQMKASNIDLNTQNTRLQSDLGNDHYFFSPKFYLS
jgi:hypothetical protein